MDKKHLINVLLILAIGIIVYANSFGGEFIFDDRVLIRDNLYIKSFKNIGHIFSSEFFNDIEGFNFYRPLAAFLDMLDYSIWRLNPFGYHLTNFMLHFIVTCLIYAALYNLFKNYYIVLFLSLLFLTHPSATEAITYIAGRADPLAFIFLLISLLLSTYFFGRTPSKNKLYYGLSVISFALACLSKEIAVVFPAFLFLYTLLNGKQINKRVKRNLLLMLPYLLISAGAVFLRYSVLMRAQNAFFTTDNANLFLRVLNLPLIIFKYIAMFVFPRSFVFEQSMNYYTSILCMPIFASTVAAIIFLVLLIKFYDSRMILGLTWFLTFILPVSGIISINAPIYHHWLYIPSLGLLIILATLLLKLRNYMKGSKLYKVFFYYALPLIGILVITVFSVLSIKQNIYFKNEGAFYQQTIAKGLGTARMHHNLGLVYVEKGMPEKAINEFKNAINLKPDYLYAYMNLGYAYQVRGEYGEAEKTLKKSIDISPKSWLPYYYLANLYIDTNRLFEGIELYKKAIGLRPDNPGVYYNLAIAYDKNGDIDDAIKTYQKCIELNPAYISAYLNLGAIFGQRGQFDQAREIWEKGLKLEPDNSAIKENLAKLKRLQ